jgi:hypothetical protein
MSKVDDYVEAYVTDGLKRQLEQEENIVRSLPFFATALSLIILLVGAGRGPRCQYDGHWLSATI